MQINFIYICGMEIKIEKNKVPASNTKWLDVLGKLEVGESFLVPIEKRNNVACIATQWFNKSDGGRLIKSTIKGQPEGMVRFWREL